MRRTHWGLSYLAVGTFLTIVLVGVALADKPGIFLVLAVLVLGLSVLHVGFSLCAALKAANGVAWEYPFAVSFVSS